MSDEFLIPPPNTMIVEHSHRPVLYLPDGRVLVRQAGFRGEPPMAGQTRGTFPQLNKGGKKGGKGGKRGC